MSQNTRQLHKYILFLQQCYEFLIYFIAQGELGSHETHEILQQSKPLQFILSAVN